MKIITWNVRGINASDKRGRIKQLLDFTKGDIILLQETKLSAQVFDKTLAKWTNWLSVHAEGHGASGGLAILWNAKSIHGILIGQDSNWQLLKVEHFDLKFLIFNIYGPTSTNDKRNLWAVLTNLIQQEREMNFILGGDFNALLSMSEKKGGICPPIRTIQDFSSFVEDNNLSDILPMNGLYTWTNRRIGFLEIVERLDRFLFSQSWKLLIFSFKSKILPFSISRSFSNLVIDIKE